MIAWVACFEYASTCICPQHDAYKKRCYSRNARDKHEDFDVWRLGVLFLNAGILSSITL